MSDSKTTLPAQRSITSVESLRAMASPLRVRLLQQLARRACSVKELAAALDESQTKLYRHLELMVEHGFVAVVEIRTDGRLPERRYRATARSFVLDTSVLGQGGPSVLDQTLSFVLDTTRSEIKAGASAGTIDLSRRAPDPRALVARRCVLQLTPEQAQRYYRSLVELAVDVVEDDPTDTAPTRPYGLAVVFYPAEAVVDDD